MFQYNRFWHFWSTLDNRHYLRAVIAAALLAMIAAVFFAPVLLTSYLGLCAIVVVSSLTVGFVITVLNTLSDFFYSQQNETLRQLKQDTSRPTTEETPEEKAQRTLQRFINEQVDLYINNRCVAPNEAELIEAAQQSMSLSKPFFSAQITAQAVRMNPPLHAEHSEVLTLNVNLGENRNQSFTARSTTGNDLFIKQTKTPFALNERAAQEMAEIAGFKGLIPSNTIRNTKQPITISTTTIDNNALLLSKQNIADYLHRERQDIKNTDQVQKTVLKFISQMQHIRYKIQSKKNELPTLTYVQALVPNAENGLTIIDQIFSEDPSHHQQVQQTLRNINIESFQSNFLLALFLGSQDANPGNTLLVSQIDANGRPSINMHSIDHEQIMPENNYNITKQIPICNGQAGSAEKPIDNVFPIKLWLAGLPHANVPFSKAVMEHTLSSLDPVRILAYHRHKKLFTPTAVAAQLERIKLIRDAFEAECLKPEITLTPKALFLKLVNNHPSYDYLKNTLEIKSDLLTFFLVGMIPEDAELSLTKHPLQYGPILGKFIEMIINEANHKRYAFSAESFESPYAAKCVFFLMADQHKQVDTAYESTLTTITQATTDALLAEHSRMAP